MAKRIKIKIEDLFNRLGITENLCTELEYSCKIQPTVKIKTPDGSFTDIIEFVMKKCNDVQQITFSNDSTLIVSKKHIIMTINGLKKIEDISDDLIPTNDGFTQIIHKIDLDNKILYDVCLQQPHLFIDTSGIIHHNSLIISYIIKALLDDCKIQRAIIIVPTQSLVEQFYTDMKDYGMNCASIGRVYSKIKEYNKQIVISTWQSLSRKLDWIEDFDCVICDEVHGVKGVELRKILSRAINADYRIGVTGTLPVTKLDMFNVKGFIGPVVKEYGSAELADQGYISHCNIKYTNIGYNNPERYSGEYNEVKDKIFNNLNRMKYIKNIVKNADSNILLLVGKVESEGKILQEYLGNIKGKEIVFIWGNTPVAEREQWRAECEKRKNIILIATYGILQVGVNIPSLKYILFASPFKSKIRVLQSIGRALRKHETKDVAVIYDLADDVQYLSDHSMRRLRYYKSEKFTVEETTIHENVLSLS